MAISKQREILSGDQTGFESDTKQQTREELMLKAKDLMVFSGLVKLRLAKGVWEGIIMGAGEVGGLIRRERVSEMMSEEHTLYGSNEAYGREVAK